MAKAKKSPETTAASRKKSLHAAADAIDEQLARYRSMRDFHVTAEPSGRYSKEEAQFEGLPFCIQKHAASHLHYPAVKSIAVPSLDDLIGVVELPWAEQVEAVFGNS